MITGKFPTARRDENNSKNYHGIEVQDAYHWLELNTKETKTYVDEQNRLCESYLLSYNNREAIARTLQEYYNYTKYYGPFRAGDKYYQFRSENMQSVLYTHETLDGLQSFPMVFLDPKELVSESAHVVESSRESVVTSTPTPTAGSTSGFNMGFKQQRKSLAVSVSANSVGPRSFAHAPLPPERTITIQNIEFSPNGKLLAYQIKEAGSDWSKIKFKDVETRKSFDEVLTHCKFTQMSWMQDNESFFYSAYMDYADTQWNTHPLVNERLYYHRLGTNQADDLVIVDPSNKYERPTGQVSYCGKYLVVCGQVDEKNNSLHIATLKSICKKSFNRIAILEDFNASCRYVTNTETKFVFITDKNAPNYAIVAVDISHPEEWSTLVSTHSKLVLVECKAINNQLVLLYQITAKYSIHVRDISTGRKLMEFPFDVGNVEGLSGSRDQSEMFIMFSSLVTPCNIYRIDFNSPHVKPNLFQETKHPRIKLLTYEVKNVFFKSLDGKKIPMFLFYKRGMKQDGNNPCLLFASGGFNFCKFSIRRLFFAACFNGIVALPVMRGGGISGSKWHEAGKGLHKQKSFDDFQAAAKFLIKGKFTQPNKLIMQGKFSGGLVVGASLNQTPELFGAAIVESGILDMLRYDLFTIGHMWKAEFGSSDDKEQFNNLIQYSPVHNVNLPRKGQFPAVLLLTGRHEDEVVSSHSLKFIAELQFKVGGASHNACPLMLKVHQNTVQGKRKASFTVVAEYVDIFCFMGKALALSFNPNK